MSDDLRRQLALAKVGMRALIDEATGYQAVRDPEDLRQYAYAIGLDDINELLDERIALAQDTNTKPEEE